MHFAAFVGAQEDGFELSSHPIIFCQRFCRLLGMVADANTGVAMRTSMPTATLKKSSLKAKDCGLMKSQVSG